MVLVWISKQKKTNNIFKNKQEKKCKPHNTKMDKKKEGQFETDKNTYFEF